MGSRRKQGVQGEFYSICRSEYQRALGAETTEERDKALEKAEAARLAALGVLPLGGLSETTMQRVMGDVRQDLREIDRTHDQAATMPVDPMNDRMSEAYWADMIPAAREPEL